MNANSFSPTTKNEKIEPKQTFDNVLALCLNIVVD
jgi:hypothetical protein